MSSSLYTAQHLLQDSQVGPTLKPDDKFGKSSRSLSPYGYNGVKIMFDPTVEVSESHTLYSSFGVLAQIGGSLGLYLGVSLIDIYKLFNKVAPCLANISRFFRSNKNLRKK